MPSDPSSLLILLGFIAVIIAVLFPIGAALQFFFGGLGILMIIGGIILALANGSSK